METSTNEVDVQRYGNFSIVGEVMVEHYRDNKPRYSFFGEHGGFCFGLSAAAVDALIVELQYWRSQDVPSRGVS